MTDPSTPEGRAEIKARAEIAEQSRIYIDELTFHGGEPPILAWQQIAESQADVPALLDALGDADNRSAFIESISDMNDMHAYQWQERAKAAEATLARVTEVINSPYWGTYWGEVMVPQPHLLRALGGDRP